MIIYVNFSNSDKDEIVEVFSCPQSNDEYPNQGVVEEDSDLYKEFLNAFNQP